MRERGTVVYWKTIPGFGFVRPDGGGPDVFTHYTGIESEARFRELPIGARQF